MIRSQLMAREFEGEGREVAPIWVSVPARGAPAVRKEERSPSLTAESQDLPNFEGRMG